MIPYGVFVKRRSRLMKFYILYIYLILSICPPAFGQSTDNFFSKTSPNLPSKIKAKYSTAFQGNIGVLNITGLKLGFNGRFSDIEYAEKSQSPFRWMQQYGMGLWFRSYLPIAKERLVIYADASAGYCLFYFPYEESISSLVNRIKKPRYFGYYYSLELGVRFRINKNFTIEVFSPNLTVKDFDKHKVEQISSSFPTFAAQLLITKPF